MVVVSVDDGKEEYIWFNTLEIGIKVLVYEQKIPIP